MTDNCIRGEAYLMKDLFRNIKVLSLEQATVLPYLTYRLAMDGMQVIRMEHPERCDPNRMIGENVLGESRMNTYFLCINAGKKAITLNLAQSRGRRMLKELISGLDIDIFTTNQLPRNYEKLGIDYDALKSVKDDIIWLGVSGFGPTINEGAYDPILQARSGLMEMTGEHGQAPQVLGIPLPDMGTSEHAYGMIMKALYMRERTGKGTRIDLSMLESSVSWLTVPITFQASFDRQLSRRGNTHAFFCPVSVYRTRDGFVYLAVGNDRQWKSMVSLSPFESLDRSEYEKNSGRIADVENLNLAIEQITCDLPSDDLIRMFQSITVPISKIQTMVEVIADPLIRPRLLSSLDPVTGTRITMAPPPYMTEFLEHHHQRLEFAPRLGEHNTEIYQQLPGMTSQTLSELEQKGVI